MHAVKHITGPWVKNTTGRYSFTEASGDTYTAEAVGRTTWRLSFAGQLVSIERSLDACKANAQRHQGYRHDNVR